jgi:transposase
MWKTDCRESNDRGCPRFASDLTEREWKLIETLIPPGKPGGGKRTVNMREVVNGLLYVLSTGCRWRDIPKELPPRSTVHDYFDLWSHDGTLQRIHFELFPQSRTQTTKTQPDRGRHQRPAHVERATWALRRTTPSDET